VAAGLAVLLFLGLHKPLDPLHDVAEPITIVDAVSWDDGGSRSLAYKDAKGVVRDACLLDDLNGNQNLVLGSYTPIHNKRRLENWPVGGSKERAFLQVLKRWAVQNPDAIRWDQRLDRYERGEIDLKGFWDDSPAEQRVTAIAVGVLRDLHRRNYPECRTLIPQEVEK
jgi:hypothetical protein